MNEKEVGELRRRLRPGKNNATHICGCYVRDNGEIIAKFRESLGMMPEDEQEKYLALFRRTMSGGLGRNMLDISFETKEVAYGEEHKLLMKLRETAVNDEATLDAFYQKVIPTVHMENNYVILLLQETYDVPFRGRDGRDLEDASDTQFSYIVCCICPVKQTKSLLSYQLDVSSFHNSQPDWVVSAPELGFLFPAFDSRRTNLYNALYYTHNLADTHPDFVEAIFKTEAPMSVNEQKETFQSLLMDTLEEDCSLQVMQTVHGQLAEMIETHKVSKDPEPLLLSKGQMQSVLQSCGVSEAHAEQFAVHFEEEYGENTDVSPKNILDVKRFEVKTPDVVIQVNPERSDLIETRIIGGVKYLLIHAEEGVEVNGVPIKIPDLD